MGASILTALPAQIQAGDSLKVRLSFSGFLPSDGWSSTMYLAGAVVKSKAATADGDGFLFSWTTSDTEALVPGIYQLAVRATSGSDSCTVASGQVEVLADLATAADGALQDFAEKTLAVVEAALAGRLTSDLESYTIAGRSVSKIPISELMKIRNILRAQVAVKNSDGQGFGQSVEVVFGDSSSIGGTSPFGSGRFPWG